MLWVPPETWTHAQLVTAGDVNEQLRDNMLALPHPIILKSADESVVSSTALQDDNELALPVVANGIYRVEFHLMFSGDAAGDIQFGFTFPSGGRIAVSAIGDNAAADTTWYAWHGTDGASGGTGSWAFNCFDGRSFVLIHGMYINGSTAGTLQLQWAQNASNATASVVYANSMLWATQVA
jgi:hypothetical protein